MKPSDAIGPGTNIPQSDPATPDKMKEIVRLMETARQVLAPHMTLADYHRAIVDFETRLMGRVKNVSHQNRSLTPQEMALLSDNSAKYETLAYRYNGLGQVKEMLGDGKPVAFVGWHHGARDHADYALARIVPDIAIFTRWVVQYGTVFAIPMAVSGGLGLVKMKRFMEDGRPVFYYLDGLPGGDCVTLPMLGIDSRFSTAPITMFQSVAGLRIVPVSNFYVDEGAVAVKFHAPLGPGENFANMDARDILASLLAPLEREQRRHGPAQVLITQFPHREQLAREATARR